MEKLQTLRNRALRKSSRGQICSADDYITMWWASVLQEKQKEFEDIEERNKKEAEKEKQRRKEENGSIEEHPHWAINKRPDGIGGMALWRKEYFSPEQVSANYILQDKSGPLPVFVNKAFVLVAWEMQPCPFFTYCLWLLLCYKGRVE